MKIHISGHDLRFDLADHNSPFIRIYVDEELQAELTRLAIGETKVEGPKDLEARLQGANAAHAACIFFREAMESTQSADPKGKTEEARKRKGLDKIEDHVIPKAKKGEAFAAGFYQGLLGEHMFLKGMGGEAPTGPLPPEHKLSGPTHQQGWRIGDAIRRALAIAERGELNTARNIYGEEIA